MNDSKVHLEEQKVENGDNLKENMTRKKALLSIMVLSSYRVWDWFRSHLISERVEE